MTLLATRCADARSRAFGLDPSRIGDARKRAPTRSGIWSFTSSRARCSKVSILPLGIVEAIVGQSRLDVLFEGNANHAGTTPMNLRRDALAGAAEWIGAVEREARASLRRWSRPWAASTCARAQAT